MEKIIVSRHKGLVDWLADKGITGEVVAHVSNPDTLIGREVYGVLPLSLAAKAARVIEVAMPDLLPEQRGKELSIEDMDKAGAHLRIYAVVEINEYAVIEIKE